MPRSVWPPSSRGRAIRPAARLLAAALAAGALLAGAPGTGVLGGVSAQDELLRRYEELRAPRITTRADETMLVVRAQGDPNEVGAAAFGLVFQLYYSIPETPKGPLPPVPRARWPEDLGTPQAEWVGWYALPVPASVTALPPHSAPPGLEASLQVWEYGEIAEILHVGPYDAEQPTMDRLAAYLEEAGYETVGGHEEEYLRGPTMAGPGDPDNYLTTLRYRIRKRSPQSSPSEKPGG